VVEVEEEVLLDDELLDDELVTTVTFETEHRDCATTMLSCRAGMRFEERDVSGVHDDIGVSERGILSGWPSPASITFKLAMPAGGEDAATSFYEGLGCVRHDATIERDNMKAPFGLCDLRRVLALLSH